VNPVRARDEHASISRKVGASEQPPAATKEGIRDGNALGQHNVSRAIHSAYDPQASLLARRLPVQAVRRACIGLALPASP